MRILALDWGVVRVGAAVSDPDGKIAFPLDKFIDAKKAVEEIKETVEKLEVEKILVGYPKNLSGQSGSSAEKVDRFVSELKKVVSVQIELLDERFTSVEAGKRLADAGMNQQQQREVKDNIAAQIMLQSYLDTNIKTT